MAPKSLVARKLRFTPTMPFTLEFEGDKGAKETIGFLLNYDFNASVLVEEKTGFNGLSGAIFNVLSAHNLSVLLWAMVQANHPEYAGDEGLVEIRSMLTHRNSDAVAEAVEENFIRNLSDEKQVIIRASIAEAKAKSEAKSRGENPAEGGASPLAVATPALS